MINNISKQGHTIVAISTALAKSAISIVRLSGEGALNIAYRFLSGKQSTLDFRIELIPRHAKLCDIYDSGGRLLDKAILIYFKAPFSFNGEDIVEIQSHGGVLIAQEILKSALEFGAMLASPGEFSKRALYNGKMDILELEATLAIINNTNTNLTQLLARNLTGQCAKMLESSRQTVLEIIAQIEVNIDYSDEDLDPKILEKSINSLGMLVAKFSSIVESSAHYSRLQGIKLSILGKPNVGKSSLLNLLLLRDRAIVSEIAGTTRDVISESLDINGNIVYLHDTAGIRTSFDSIENDGIQRSFDCAKESDILICLFDLSREMDNDDYRILDFISSDLINKKDILVLLNKNDLELRNYYDFSRFNHCSINTKDISNRQIITQKIDRFLTMHIDNDTLVFTNAMQTNLLENALHNLEKASSLLSEQALELASFELMESLQNLGAITKPYNVEEMLDSMFSQFCVGK
ncbi:tRNA uridine-5-carboxymethylaminomethyl(34) synthesis GTPase MnmE [Helicobacter muridarum]|uniref:tRNA modification GTPase MnmE n=1 Tax=Helicobacter muridarum TaxID=216 RepID=A0A099TV50_9HELI|nr:tRNA uridine-5-carboxymethylaminomethyl(34) synthesis GTPase MnmE [Helicobacter muridarum]TLE01577.1 tRNA uridine-5-carboxymethylaminomethyl(34) synthesis GTPase MnmE [Helicobacter muridarum]STQ86186.1 tRNA modification GTPase TrmE [Helicobacter muridarum]